MSGRDFPGQVSKLEQDQVNHLRSLAWRFRESRGCHWGGVDRSAPLLDYCEALLLLGVDRREVLQELLCSVRCCGDCK